MTTFRCDECGELFADRYGEIGTRSAPECPKCGEEQRVSEVMDAPGRDLRLRKWAE